VLRDTLRSFVPTRSGASDADPRRWALRLAAIALLPLATVLVAIAEAPPLRIPDASPLYLIAVVGIAVVFGTAAAIAAAVASFLLYNALFVEPRFTLTVADPEEWLNLLLLLFVGIVIGRLAALQAARADDAARRAGESRALFRISRTLATGPRVTEAIPIVIADLLAETRMSRIWVVRQEAGREVVIADSGAGPRPSHRIHVVLTRTPGDLPARWVQEHQPQDRPGDGRPDPAVRLFRTTISAGDEAVGSIWATRRRADGTPDREETRLLSLAADQVGLAFRREALIATANAAEVARQGEALKDALLDSVSHGFRTPLATIRAAAGSLLDPEVTWSDGERRAAARTIDAEAERLNVLVRNLLDMSRIEAGELRPSLEALDVEGLIGPVVERVTRSLGRPPVQIAFGPDLPPIRADASLFDEILANLLENAARYAPDAVTRVSANSCPDGRVRIRVEDAGPGVPAASLPRLFDKFYRVPRPGEGPRRGLGIGLGVVKGLAEAMGGEVAASASELGGLAVDVFLQAAPEPPGEPEELGDHNGAGPPEPGTPG
jgi:two-component system, OmpR family, sensor histidine kinase KdpD